MKRKDPQSQGPFKHKMPAKGKDEMNLAEFPLAVLSDRVPAGQNTLTFQDRGYDKSRGGYVDRRVTVLGCERYGLPTALDEDVVLGLLQLTWQTGFAGRRVYFSRYGLIQLLGWRDEGKSYRRLEKSLMRWLGVTLSYENSWWDKRDKVRRTESFHLLNNVVLHHRICKDSHLVTKQTDLPLSSFTWNELVFRSFHVGFLKGLDMDLYRALKRPVAKRMYRFLDKRFHHKECWSFDLRTFACEHVGLSRNYDNGQLKRRLHAGVAELESAGYLDVMSNTERYRKTGRAQWLVLFRKASPSEQTGRRATDATTPSKWKPRFPTSCVPVGRRAMEKECQTEKPTEEERKVAEHLASLSKTQLVELESRAFEKADTWVREGFERCVREGHRATIEGYRRMILEAGVRREMKGTA